MPATLATLRAAKSQSTKRPARYAPAAIVNMQRPRSAAKTRPRNLSSLCRCNRVVENTQTIDPPECASITHKHDPEVSPEDRDFQAMFPVPRPWGGQERPE